MVEFCDRTFWVISNMVYINKDKIKKAFSTQGLRAYGFIALKIRFSFLPL